MALLYAIFDMFFQYVLDCMSMKNIKIVYFQDAKIAKCTCLIFLYHLFHTFQKATNSFRGPCSRTGLMSWYHFGYGYQDNMSAACIMTL